MSIYPAAVNFIWYFIPLHFHSGNGMEMDNPWHSALPNTRPWEQPE